MTLEELKGLLEKRCVTAHRAVDPRTGGAMLYRRTDLSKMAKEAYERGELYFHCKLENPDEPFGKLMECEPEYVYVLSRALTEEEYESLGD